MFETEVEEWADEMYPCDGQAQRYLIEGAEFGYNKANEWHYVKDGDLPKKDSEVLIEYGDNNTHIVVDWISNTKMFGAFCVDEVKRWKEIVLPKESE